jgi:hypothetical protein
MPSRCARQPSGKAPCRSGTEAEAPAGLLLAPTSSGVAAAVLPASFSASSACLTVLAAILQLISW